MTLTIHLSPELEQRLQQAASPRGLPLDEYTMQLLDKYLPPTDHRTEIVALLQSWLDEKDAEEQRDTGDYLIRALDEDRFSDRPLFPTELKEISW